VPKSAKMPRRNGSRRNKLDSRTRPKRVGCTPIHGGLVRVYDPAASSVVSTYQRETLIVCFGISSRARILAPQRKGCPIWKPVKRARLSPMTLPLPVVQLDNALLRSAANMSIDAFFALAVVLFSTSLVALTVSSAESAMRQ
jgi:hypothetical protein